MTRWSRAITTAPRRCRNTCPTPRPRPRLTRLRRPRLRRLRFPSRDSAARRGAAHRVVVIGAGLAGLVAAYELKRQGHQVIVLEAQNRVGGRIHTLRGVRPGPVRRGRRDAHPARARPDPRVLPAVRPAPAAVRDGQPQGPRLPQRRADDDRGRPTPSRRGCRSSWPTTSAAGPPTSSGSRRSATCGRWSSTRARPPGPRSSARYDQFSLYEFLREKRWSEGAIEYYAVMNFLEADMHNAVDRDPARGHRQGLRRHAGDRGRDGSPAERVLRRAPRRGPARAPRSFAIDQEPDSVVVHYKTEAGRYRAVGDYAVCTVPVLGPAHDRDRPAVLATRSAGRSAS